MGKVFLRVKTDNNDGIPTDAVGFVGGTFPGSTTHEASGNDAKNPRIKVLTPSADDYTHYEGTGFTADAIIILNDDSTTHGKIDVIRVLTRGSNYSTPPSVTFGSETFTATLGTGEPARESILIAEDGAQKNSHGLFLIKKGNGQPDVNASDFADLFGAVFTFQSFRFLTHSKSTLTTAILGSFPQI
jgi:hypothetical protein